MRDVKVEEWGIVAGGLETDVGMEIDMDDLRSAMEDGEEHTGVIVVRREIEADMDAAGMDEAGMDVKVMVETAMDMDVVDIIGVTIIEAKTEAGVEVIEGTEENSVEVIATMVGGEVTMMGVTGDVQTS